MSDDHDADAISAYNNQFIFTPHIDRIAREGIRFTNAFVGNSICAPARATLLTGQHSHIHGVKDNHTRFDSSRLTLPTLLQQAGYQTAIIGKWHLHSYPSGFDYWKILPGQGLYVNPRFITMQGDTVPHRGYATDVITDEVLTWLAKRDTAKPFVLFFHHKAPHRNFFPRLKYLEVYTKKTFPEPPTLYNDTAGRGSAWRMQTMSILHDMRLTTDLKIDPDYLMNTPWLKPDSDEMLGYSAIMSRLPDDELKRYEAIYAERGKLIRDKKPEGKELLRYKYQWYMQDYLACVASLDESVGRLLEYMDKNNLSQNTVVIYTSDQGFYLGENGWFDKRFAYDVSMSTPLLVRWPGIIKPHTVSHTLVQNIDFAPSMLDIAGIAIPAWMQGISLKSVLTGKQKTVPRKNLYYRYYEFGTDHSVIPHLAIRSQRYKLIYFHTVNEWEFYDLKKDPGEQNNVARLPEYRRIFLNMKKQLKKLKNQYDDRDPAGELK